MQKIAVLTGAGISAESGLSTFRDSGGLWAGHDVTEVASPAGWESNQELVLDFYNQRRRAAKEAHPNKAHFLLAELEAEYEVSIITQNVDDLHERGGSSNIMHLHGELGKSRSTIDPTLVYDIDGTELITGDLCEKGSQLRPHIVWFGEMVPLLEDAAEIVSEADIMAIIGTSLLVYPAASLIHYTRPNIPIYIIDQKMPTMVDRPNLHKIEMSATLGAQVLFDELTKADVP